MIVLDTHTWIWWVDDDPKLKREVRDRIDKAADVRLSAISILDVATASSLGKLKLRPSTTFWIDVALFPEQLSVEPIRAETCFASVSLPGEFHRDPADRLIVALARELNAELVTADHKILTYPHVKTIAAV